jgi:hypothetical protein
MKALRLVFVGRYFLYNKIIEDEMDELCIVKEETINS